MVVSDYFDVDEVISQLNMLVDDVDDDDLKSVVGQAVEVEDNVFEVRLGSRVFRFDGDFCDVEEVL